MTKKEHASIPHHWGWLFVFGLLLVFLGAVGLSMEIMLTVASMYVFAVLLIIAGVSHGIDSFKYRQWQGVLWQVLIALLYLGAGLIVLYDPLLASTLITALLACLLIMIGISRLVMGFSLKHTPGWVWRLFAGFCSLILGVLILLQWPFSGLWVIGMFIAIDLMVSGWTYMFMALALKRA